MAVRQLAPGVHQVPLGGVNAYLVDDGDALTLIDAGLPKRDRRILAAIEGLGRRPRDVRDIVVSHYHLDHIGSLAALAAASEATVWAHAADTPVVRDGTPPPFPTAGNPVVRALSPLMAALAPKRAAPAPVTGSATDGAQLPVAGGLLAIHTPGHTPGHLSFLWPRHGGVLFCGDALSNLLRVSLALLNEDNDQARRSLARLTGLEFQVACFGHGRPVTSDAAATIGSAVTRVARVAG